MVKKKGPEEGVGAKSSSVKASFLDDEKFEQGREQTMNKLSGMKGPSSKEMRQERKADIQRRIAKEQEKVSWKKQVMTIVAILFMCGAGLGQFISTVWTFMQGNGIENVDVADTAKLKAVLFGGDPWLVYCVNEDTRAQRLPRVLEESAHDLRSSLGVKTGVLGCWDKTESGRSVAERFKLNLKPPLSFVVANGNKPRLLNLGGVSKLEDLEKKIKPVLKTDTYKIDTLKKWGSLCTSRKTCVVIGHKNTAQRDYALGIFRPLLDTYRAAKVVTLDTSFWQLKLDEGVLATRSVENRGKGAAVVCLVRDDSSAGGNATHSGVFMQMLDASSAPTFLQACTTASGLVKLESPPRIKARPSKPKKVSKPSPSPAPRPRPPPAPKRDASKGHQDHVGSRANLESEEPLFEAVDEDEEDDESEGGDDDEDDGEEVEL